MSESDDNISDMQVESEAEPSTSSSLVRSKLLENSKRYKKGIVYLSFVPIGMTPLILRHLLGKYGEIGRIFLQPAKTAGLSVENDNKKKKKRKRREYGEAWVEFMKKKKAKQVAAMLNNQQVGGKKKNKFHDYIWNIKYLSRFKWVHLSERMTYEKAVFKQRMHTEINQAKKIASYFVDKVEASERQQHIMKRKIKKGTQAPGPGEGDKHWVLSTFFKQKQTDEEKLAKQSKKNQDRKQFLNNIFT